MSHSLKAPIGFILAIALACLGLARPADGADPIVRKCAKRLAKSIQAYSEDYFETVGECHLENLDDDPNVDCAADEDVGEDVAKAAEKVTREVRKCDDGAFRALCPLEGRNVEEFEPNLLGSPTSFSNRLGAILHEVFVEDNGPACPRPHPLIELPNPVEDCAKILERAVREATEDLQKCFFGCMQSELQAPLDEPCIDDLTGLPTNRKVQDCVENEADDFLDEVTNRCELDSQVVALGCPMGANNVADVVDRLWDDLYAEVRAVNLAVFQSPCRTTFDGPGGEPGDALPADVTLFPSLTQKQVRCGDVLDADFFGTDNIVRFDTDLNCGPIAAPTDGIVVAASGVTIDGDTRNRVITGPAGGANRTGTGIRVAPGVTGVKIKDFKGIDFFGVGIGDSGNNTGLEIDRVTVRRNTIAGIRTTSPGVDIEDVVADRNTVGFDLSGDDTQLRKPRARRSGPTPGYGIFLHGTDVNGNGRAVRVSEGDIEDNVVGVWAEGQGHRIEENDVRGNILEGIILAGTGIRLDDTAIKLSGSDGVVVSGDLNEVTACRAEQNVGDGYVISGNGNDVNGNVSGTLADLGNGGNGYTVSGTDNVLTSNRAEANLGSAFAVADGNTLHQNDAKSNQGIGFHVTGAGTSLTSNVAETNGGFEFDIAAGNSGSGNRANGATFGFSGAGGKFE